MSSANKAYEDAEIANALEFFLSKAPSKEQAEQRIAAAEAHFKAVVAGKTGQPGLQDLELQDDRWATYLAQAKALTTDTRGYDLVLGSKVIPYFKRIGTDLELLRTIDGVDQRVARLFTNESATPDDCLLELLVALAYRRHGFDVALLPENPGVSRTPDILAERTGLSLFAECKRVRPGEYQLRERARVQQMWRLCVPEIERHRLSVFVDVEFKSEPESISDDALFHLVRRAVRAPAEEHSIDSTDLAATIRPARIDVLRDRLSREYVLANSTQFARLLTGLDRPRANTISVAGYRPHREDNRYMDEVDIASLMQWSCTAERSLEAKSRHVLSRLARANRQLPEGHNGAVHIAMDVINDIEASDRQHYKNLAAIDGFDRERTGLSWVYLNYFLPEISEQEAWSIVETAVSRPVPGCAYPNPLPNSSLIVPTSESDATAMAWHHPPENHIYNA